MARISRRRKIKQWLSVTARSIGAVFYPKNIKNAFKTVLFSFKEYLCFFLALFAVQTGFLTVAFMTDTNLHHAEATVRAEYSHHIEVVGLDQEQKVNLQYSLDLAVTRLDQYLVFASFYEESPGVWVAKLTLDESQSLSAGYSHIKNKMLSTISQEGWVVRTTPLFDFGQDYLVPYKATFWGVTLLWVLLSMAVLWVLYRIRVNHFKFVYGVYMTCGADFPKLYGTAGGELLAISTLTLIPAVLAGGGITAGMYLTKGITPTITVGTALGFLAFSLLTVLLSVYVPMRRMAVKTPVTLLRSADNGSLVASPRRSLRMFGSGFPVKYELFGMWRFRKYYAGLLISAVLFAALFVSGLYLSDLEKYHDEIDPYEYTVRYGTLQIEAEAELETDENGDYILPPPTYTDEEITMINSDLDLFLEEIYGVEGVSYVDWSVITTGGSCQSHLLIKPIQISGGTVSLVPSEERASEGYTRAMREYQYTAFDKAYIDTLVNNSLCTFEGDPYRLLTEENMVIISEDVNNSKCYNFAPGDKVMVAVYEETKGVIPVTFDVKELLRQQIKHCRFRYVEYTVCAVMRGSASDENITFGVTFEDYTELADKLPVRDHLKVYMKDGTDYATVDAAEGKIRRAISGCSGWLVEPTGHYFKTHIDGMKQDRGMILMLSALLLMISPLVWFFSQIMYYRKRKNELNLLLALGAERRSLGTLHRVAGGILSGLAFLVTAMLSYICNFAVHMMLNTLLPKFGIIENVYYPFELSLPALIGCLLVSVICGFMSCELPYRLFLKDRKKHPDSISVNG